MGLSTPAVLRETAPGAIFKSPRTPLHSRDRGFGAPRIRAVLDKFPSCHTLALLSSPLLSAMPSVTPPTLLVVDDTPASLGVVCDALRREGVRVLLAESGAAAREVLARTLPDLVLLDVMMPGEDGFAVCAALRTHPRWREIPIIFLTSVDIGEQKVRAFAAGAVDYVTKPVHVPELVARVQVQLALRAARRALETKNHELEAEVAVRLDAEEQLSASLDRAVLVLDRAGNLLFGTRLAHDLIAKYFPASRPAALAAAGKFPAPGGEGALIVRRFAEAGRDDTVMLVLEEEHAPPGPAALIALGLTVRQAEVAYWVAQGKSNAETAMILGTSPRTIDKHMERIFVRLGVENRASLIVTAGELLRPER
jgi:DNA-binding response OmpR family regulator/DNA-binding CsgD family transcriptional regulator